LPRYLDQEKANLSEGTFSVFELNCHLLLAVYPLVGIKAIPVSALPKDTTSELCRPIFTLSLFYAERQARKLWIPNF